MQSSDIKIYWNYFLAIERDIDVITRYIEFNTKNFDTYSIELAHILFAAASEIDVVAKLVCRQIDPHTPAKNINNYRLIIMKSFPEIAGTSISIPRYGLSFSPWKIWQDGENPFWWKSYNNIKHERNKYFKEASLVNALNATCGLILLIHRYYRTELSPNQGKLLSEKDTSYELVPEPILLRFPEYYYHRRVCM